MEQIPRLLHELQSQVPSWMGQVLHKVGFNMVSDEYVKTLTFDMGLTQVESKSEFLAIFPEAMLKLLVTESPIEVTTVTDLLHFAQNYLNGDILLLKKHSVLRDIYRELNYFIQGFFRQRKQLIFELSNLEKRKLLERRRQAPTEERQVAKIDSTTIQKCPNCLCNKGQSSVTVKSATIQCRLCQHFYHLYCLKVTTESHHFMCPECVITRIDPMHRVSQVLCEAVPFRPTQHAPSKSFTFPLKERFPHLAVEVRCIKLDGKYGAEEITWPDVGDLSVNGRRIFEFKPIQNNSALKKRKDEKCYVRDVTYHANNTIQIREGVPTGEQRLGCRVSLGSVYFVGVYLVQPLMPAKLIEEVVHNPVSWMSLDDCREAISLYMKKISVADVQVEQVTVQLICQFDTRLIQTPVRGNLCEHIQCFSLENMVHMMHKLTPRKWRCPICKAKSFNFVVDSYQMMILNVIRKFNLKFEEVCFNATGRVQNEELCRLLDANPYFMLPDHAQRNTNRNLQLELLRRDAASAGTPRKPIEDIEPAPRKQVSTPKPTESVITID